LIFVLEKVKKEKPENIKKAKLTLVNKKVDHKRRLFQPKNQLIK